MNKLYEILVPTVRNDGRPIKTRCHRVWDAAVRKITGGLTILTPAKGQWVAPDGQLFSERMIPVRVMCSEAAIHEIADMTAKFYEQKAIFFYKVSDEVQVKHYKKSGVPAAPTKHDLLNFQQFVARDEDHTTGPE